MAGSVVQRVLDTNVEGLSSQCEEDNPNDMYVVAVKTATNTIVGHVPSQIWQPVLYVCIKWTTVCKTTGSRELL